MRRTDENVCGLDRDFFRTNHMTAEAHFKVISSVKVERKLWRGWSHARPFIQRHLTMEHFTFYFFKAETRRDPYKNEPINILLIVLSSPEFKDN